MDVRDIPQTHMILLDPESAESDSARVALSQGRVALRGTDGALLWRAAAEQHRARPAGHAGHGQCCAGDRRPLWRPL